MVDWMLLAGLKPPPTPAGRKTLAYAPRTRLTPAERRTRIAKVLAEQGTLSAGDIAYELECSVRATANDLNQMARTGSARSWLEVVDGRMTRLWTLTEATHA